MGGANPPSSSDSPIARIVIEPSVSTFRAPSGLQSGLITCPPSLMVSSNRFYASSIPKGLSLVRETADDGLLMAQVYLGELYFKGDKVKQDYTEALRWYLKAAEQGDAFAQYRVGDMFSNGNGVAQDYPPASSALAGRWHSQGSSPSVGPPPPSSGAQGRPPVPTDSVIHRHSGIFRRADSEVP